MELLDEGPGRGIPNALPLEPPWRGWTQAISSIARAEEIDHEHLEHEHVCHRGRDRVRWCPVAGVPLAGLAPVLIFLASPLMMIFMMKGMRGGNSESEHRDTNEPLDQHLHH